MRAVDVPQADSLDKVREVVEAIRRGARTVAQIERHTRLSPRHISYHLHAARILQWLSLENGQWSLTPVGQKLVETAQGDSSELAIFKQSIRQVEIVKAVFAEFFSTPPPSVDRLARRIRDATNLALTTARRRARALLAWRERAVGYQTGSLFPEVTSRVSEQEPVWMSDRDSPVVPGPTLTRLRLESFKNFQEAELPLGPLTILVGANASGKSNLRDAFRFLHGIARGYTLAEIIGEKWIEGGVLQWRGIRGGTREAAFRRTGTFALEVGFHVQDRGREREATYRVQVAVDGDGRPPRLLAERLVLDGRGQFVYDSHPGKHAPTQDDPLRLAVRLRKEHQKGFVGPTVSVINNRPALLQLLEHPDVESVELKEHIKLAVDAFKSMRFLDLSPDAMRIPSLPGQVVLGDRGENLSSVLQHICEDESKKRALVEWIRELTPLDATDFLFPADQTGRVLVTLVEEDGQQTSAYSASDGTLRFLAMIGALLGPEPARLYFFEELDNGIHATRLHLLLQLIEQQTARRVCQVVATTHSPQLLSLLSPASREAAVLVYRRAGAPDAKIRHIVELPGARDVLEKQDMARLHSTGWLENAVEFAAEHQT